METNPRSLFRFIPRLRTRGGLGDCDSVTSGVTLGRRTETVRPFSKGKKEVDHTTVFSRSPPTSESGMVLVWSWHDRLCLFLSPTVKTGPDWSGESTVVSGPPFDCEDGGGPSLLHCRGGRGRSPYSFFRLTFLLQICSGSEYWITRLRDKS